jgi:eukaryotic-like serine/threonine-protein kinase
MSETTASIESIFAAAVELPTAEDRAAYVERACGGDAALRGQVQALLNAYARAGHLLDRPVPGGPELTAAYQADSQPGAVIAGRYKLLEAIGEGGMGAVWAAEQTQPVRRKVALKLIKPGMDSKSVLARFDAERQALAVLDHPNIAKVLDGGATESGRPFFVMEYVKGVPITEYCESVRLTVSDRLQLFVQVCSAVQHAHQKGIIHRDLKPSNILVAPYDDRAVPKVIDFGLAKAMHQSLTAHTLFTAHETVLGTPIYMSPEQAQLNNMDVDTRSDIYSLGVLLYELLTGTTPLEKKRLKEAAWEEVKRLIREEEPPRPSMRLSSTETLPSLAACRQTEPARLTREVRGELDWIVMKSLEKDRARRYETANGLARDIQRYLADEVVEARPPSTAYRLQKFVHRHKAQATAAGLIALALLAGVAGTTYGLIRAEQAWSAEKRRAEGESKAKLDAEAKQAEAEKQQRRAEAGEKLAGVRLAEVEAEKKKVEAETKKAQEERRKADNEKQIAVAVQVFLQSKLLGQADVEQQADILLLSGRSSAEADPKVTVRELLDRAAEELAPDRIEAAFPQPMVQAAILSTVGNTYCGVGDFQRAAAFLERSLALCRRELGPDHRDTLAIMNDLAVAYWDAGKLDLALPLFEETLKLSKAKFGPEHPVTLASMNSLATAYQDAGKLDLALPLSEQAFKLSKSKLGPEHTTTLNCMNNLARAYWRIGQLDKSIPLFEESLKLRQRKLGREHADTLLAMMNLGVNYRTAGKLDLALPLLEESLKLRKAKLGPEHPQTLTSMNTLAGAYQDAGKLDLALPLFEETLKLRKAKLGPEHPQTLLTMNNLAKAYWRIGQLDKSIPLFEETLKIQQRKLGREHAETQLIVANLGVNYKDAGRLAEALPLLEEAYRASKKHPGPRFPVAHLLDCYIQAGERQKAVSLTKEMLVGARSRLPKDSLPLAAELAKTGRLLLELKAFEEVEPLLREALAIREKAQPDAWSTFNSKSLLGGALLGQKKYAEAEPLLLAGYRGMKEREAKIPPESKDRLTEALEHLVQLYDSWGKRDEAAKWHKVIDKLQPKEENNEKNTQNRL